MRPGALGLRAVPNTPKSRVLAELMELIKIVGGDNADANVKQMLTDLREATSHNEQVVEEGKALLTELTCREREMTKRETDLQAAKDEIAPVMADLEALLPSFNAFPAMLERLEEMPNG